MDTEKLYELVKNLEPYFHGYKAKQDTLENTMGLKLRFYSSWNGKTTVSGLGAYGSHSIGCSFTKSLEKIEKDIRRRLLPEYRDSFLKKVREEQERKEKEALNLQMLEALAQASCGEVLEQYGSYRNADNKYIRSDFVTISRNYRGNYDLKIEVSFSEAMKVINALKEIFPNKEEVT